MSQVQPLPPRPTMPFDTPLSPQDELAFRQWKQQVAPRDSGEDYDFRGAFKRGFQPSPTDGHWPDTFKKPNHPTFSDESVYSSLTGTKPGHWENNTNYIPFGVQKQQNMPNPPVGYQPSYATQALQHVVDTIRQHAGSGNQKPWGFHEPTIDAGAAMGPAMQGMSDTMADPRNAWMGLGPMAAIGKWKRGWETGRELGGFRPPSSHLPDMDHLQTLNKDASSPMPNIRLDISDPNTVMEALERGRELGNIRSGQAQLREHIAESMNPTQGGGIPANIVLKLLKDKYDQQTFIGPNQWGHGPGGLYAAQDERAGKLRDTLNKLDMGKGFGFGE